MISDYLIEQIAKETKDKIKKAEIMLNGKLTEAQLIDVQVKGNALSVFINTSTSKGEITDVRLLDSKGNILMSKPVKYIKNVGYGIISSFYIRFVEEEVKEPMSIFKLRNGDYEREL